MSVDIKINNVEILSDQKYRLKKITFERTNKKGETVTQQREFYDRGNAATILLYNVENRSVILTRQFRLPSYVNGNPGGMLIEACAGMLDSDSPEECVRRESVEETGYEVKNLKKIFEVYMSAGGLTELLFFFTGTYSAGEKVSQGGGLENEQEEIEVLEMGFDEAYNMIAAGEIKDAKTIMLLQYAHINNLFER